MRAYEKNAGEVSFPLGGIGAGSIGLTADGRLVDWELFSRPNRQSINWYTHFAIRTEDENGIQLRGVCQLAYCIAL